LDVHLFDRHGRHFGNENATQRVRKRCINALQIEDEFLIIQRYDVDPKIFLEFLKIIRWLGELPINLKGALKLAQVHNHHNIILLTF
jgi:hypothetical protein